MTTKPGTTKVVSSSAAPNQSLYIKNLNDKINVADLKRALYMLFSTYGPVLDIVTSRVGLKGQKMRGQAHIVFRDVQTSTQAMRGLQNFEIFGKVMNISYARGTSSIIPKLRGTFEPQIESATANDLTTSQSIFNAPPITTTGSNGTSLSGAPHGLKRSHNDIEDEEEEVQDDASMDEEEDDAPMDEDEDD